MQRQLQKFAVKNFSEVRLGPFDVLRTNPYSVQQM